MPSNELPDQVQGNQIPAGISTGDWTVQAKCE